MQTTFSLFQDEKLAIKKCTQNLGRRKKSILILEKSSHFFKEFKKIFKIKLLRN